MFSYDKKPSKDGVSSEISSKPFHPYALEKLKHILSPHKLTKFEGGWQQRDKIIESNLYNVLNVIRNKFELMTIESLSASLI